MMIFGFVTKPVMIATTEISAIIEVFYINEENKFCNCV